MSLKWLTLSLKFLISGLLIWFLAREIDFGNAWALLREIDTRMLAGAAGVLVVQICVGGMRWHAVLNAIGDTFDILNAIRLFYISVFFNKVLPSSVGGDPVRMYKAYRLGLDLRSAVNGVLLERVVTVVALVVLADITLPWFLPRVDAATTALLMPAVWLVSTGCVASLIFLMALDRLPETLRRWQVVRGLGHLGVDARKVFLSTRHLPRALFWGILTHVNMSLVVLILAMGLGLDVIWLDCLTLMPLVLLIMTVPISIGGWGVRETAMVALFGLVGVPAEGALVLSVVFGLVGIAVSIPGGIVWLFSRERTEKPNGKDELPEPKRAYVERFLLPLYLRLTTEDRNTINNVLEKKPDGT